MGFSVITELCNLHHSPIQNIFFPLRINLHPLAVATHTPSGPAPWRLLSGLSNPAVASSRDFLGVGSYTVCSFVTCFSHVAWGSPGPSTLKYGSDFLPVYCLTVLRVWDAPGCLSTQPLMGMSVVSTCRGVGQGKTAVNIHVQGFVGTDVFISFRPLPRIGIAGSAGNSMFNFLNNCLTVFQSDQSFGSHFWFYFYCNSVWLLVSFGFFFFFGLLMLHFPGPAMETGQGSAQSTWFCRSTAPSSVGRVRGTFFHK